MEASLCYGNQTEETSHTFPGVMLNGLAILPSSHNARKRGTDMSDNMHSLSTLLGAFLPSELLSSFRCAGTML